MNTHVYEEAMVDISSPGAVHSGENSSSNSCDERSVNDNEITACVAVESNESVLSIPSFHENVEDPYVCCDGGDIGRDRSEHEDGENEGDIADHAGEDYSKYLTETLVPDKQTGRNSITDINDNAKEKTGGAEKISLVQKAFARAWECTERQVIADEINRLFKDVEGNSNTHEDDEIKPRFSSHRRRRQRGWIAEGHANTKDEEWRNLFKRKSGTSKQESAMIAGGRAVTSEEILLDLWQTITLCSLPAESDECFRCHFEDEAEKKGDLQEREQQREWRQDLRKFNAETFNTWLDAFLVGNGERKECYVREEGVTKGLSGDMACKWLDLLLDSKDGDDGMYDATFDL